MWHNCLALLWFRYGHFFQLRIHSSGRYLEFDRRPLLQLLDGLLYFFHFGRLTFLLCLPQLPLHLVLILGHVLRFVFEISEPF